MRAVLRGAGTAVAAVLLLAGCASATGVRVGKPDPGSDSTPPVCGDIVVSPGPADASGRAVCLSVGSVLRLRLDPGDRPAERGAALTEISPGVYRGARAGSAELSGFRRACPRAGQPGSVVCHAIVGWTINVDVR